jgi:hypothetical protein
MTTHTVKSVCPYWRGLWYRDGGCQQSRRQSLRQQTAPCKLWAVVSQGATPAPKPLPSRDGWNMLTCVVNGNMTRHAWLWTMRSGKRRVVYALSSTPTAPNAIAFYVSGQMSLEAQYLANKLTKGFIGTNNIESNSRLCMASADSGYKLSLGSDGPPVLTRISTVPMCFSSSGRTWRTAIQSCSCG